MPTALFYPNASPGGVAMDCYNGEQNIGGASWAGVRSGTGSFGGNGNGTLITSVEAHASDANKWVTFTRAGLLFDTSSLGSVTVTDAKLGLYVFSTSTDDDFGLDVDVVGYTPASNTVFANNDFTHYGTTLLGSIPLASLVSETYNEVSLNGSGISAIALSGITKLGLRISADRSDTEPTWAAGGRGITAVYSADNGDSAKRPYLSVTYSTPPTFKAAWAVQRSRILGGN